MNLLCVTVFRPCCRSNLTKEQKAIIMPSDPLLNVRRKMRTAARSANKLLQATGYTEETMKTLYFTNCQKTICSFLFKSGTPAAEGNILSVLDDLIELAKNADAKTSQIRSILILPDEELVAPKSCRNASRDCTKSQTNTDWHSRIAQLGK